MNTDLLKLEQNRGYVIAGIGGIVGLIAFFLPYYSFSFLTYGVSASGASSGWIWLGELLTLGVIGVAAVLVFRPNAFGLTNMPLEKQILYGRYGIIGGAGLSLLLHLIFAITYSSAFGGVYVGTTGFSAGLGFGFYLYVLAAIAMIVGGVMALRLPIQAASMPYGGYQQQQTQYPPYQQPPYQQPPYQQPPYQQQPYQQPDPSSADATYQSQMPQQYPQQYPPQFPQQQQPPSQYPQQQQPPQYPPMQQQPPQYPPMQQQPPTQ